MKVCIIYPHTTKAPWLGAITDDSITVVTTEAETDYDYYVQIMDPHVYVHIPNLNKFLLEGPQGKFGNSKMVIFDYKNRYAMVSAHPQIHECDYLGCIDMVPTGTSVNLNTLIACGNMNTRAMRTYHIWTELPYHCDLAEDNKWTLVTGFFDLTLENDVTPSSRSREFYYKTAISTLALNQNLVIYTDPANYDAIYEIRTRYGLLPKTKFVVQNFSDFPLYQHKERIIENRKKIPSIDPRNNPSYYLLCMARYAMLKATIKDNYFQSTHFAWINFNIQTMGLRNVELLDDCLSQYRDRFSTVYIGYISEPDVRNNFEFIRTGRCSMCSGFFTGSTEYMYKVCDLIEQKFVHYLELGYGHADEQLYSPVYFDHPELFEVYFGDYHQMITNYVRCYENPHPTIHFVIPGTFNDCKNALCAKACETIYKGMRSNYYKLNPTDLVNLLHRWYASAWYTDQMMICTFIINQFKALMTDKDHYPVIKNNIHAIIRFTDFHRLKDPNLKCKNLVTDAKYELNNYDPDHNIYIVYGDVPLTPQVFITENPVLRPLSLK
jgi:hypothetical protein